MRTFWDRWFTNNTLLGKISFVFGLFIFLPGVVGLLIWLNVFGVITVDDFGDFEPEEIVLESSTPVWSYASLLRAEENLPEAYRLPRDANGEVRVSTQAISQTCSQKREDITYVYPCRKGKVVLALWSGAMANCSSDSCELGLAFYDGDSCTIMIPSELSAALPVSMGLSDLPLDAPDLVMGHEWLHCLGKGHVYTPILGPIKSIPTGHILHPHLASAGWRTEGL